MTVPAQRLRWAMVAVAVAALLASGAGLGVRSTFADLGATVADLLGAELPRHGTSFRSLLEA